MLGKKIVMIQKELIEMKDRRLWLIGCNKLRRNIFVRFIRRDLIIVDNVQNWSQRDGWQH